MVAVMPHRAHRVEVDADDVAVVVAEVTVVAIHAETILHSGGRAAHSVAEHADLGELAFLTPVFVYAAILARPEQVAAGNDGRRVVGAPATHGFGVGAAHECLLIFVQVKHHAAERLLVGYSLPHIQVVVFLVIRHSAFDGVVGRQGGACGVACGEVDEIQAAAQRTYNYLVALLQV